MTFKRCGSIILCKFCTSYLCHSKVCDLNCVIRCKKKVAWLYVFVHYPLAMEVLQPIYQLDKVPVGEGGGGGREGGREEERKEGGGKEGGGREQGREGGEGGGRREGKEEINSLISYGITKGVNRWSERQRSTTARMQVIETYSIQAQVQSARQKQ